MKKIDLHVHTIQTASDSDFTFDLSKLVAYVTEKNLDVLGVTNHNRFDIDQFRTISEASPCMVLPGIEVDLEGGHILVLADPSEVVDFSARCGRVSAAVPDEKTSMDLGTFNSIFPDLARYIAIPHYEKRPPVPSEIISALGSTITAGEVTSLKKFTSCAKDSGSLVPVFFSDSRMKSDISVFPIRQTFIDVGEVSFSAIKYALSDRNKVSLTNEEGHKYFQATSNGLILSTGLNVVLGERSSGKTWTLDSLARNFDRVKYLEQFSLVEKSDTADADRFNAALRQNQSIFVQGYLREFKDCVESVRSIDLESDDRALAKYVSDLIQHAIEYEKADVFSKTAMFSETEFPEDSLSSLKSLVDAAMLLADNTEYRQLIDSFVSLDALKALAVGLIERFASENEIRLKKLWANDLIASMKAELQRKTAAVAIPEIDFYKTAMNRHSVSKFEEVCVGVKTEREILGQDIQAYRIVAKSRPFAGAGEMKSESGTKFAFSTAFQVYDKPYHFLKQLGQIAGLPETEYYKFFTTIDYKILNNYGAEVSGGERSEFRLLQEITDALQYDMLLIDEPESSFDNVFLNSDVNRLIKDISRKMPVVIVTHNSTVGASVKPDYLVHTKRIVSNGVATYETYSGHPGDKHLTSPKGIAILNHQVMLDCLEAGPDAYLDRRATYETLKN